MRHIAYRAGIRYQAKTGCSDERRINYERGVLTGLKQQYARMATGEVRIR